MYEVSDTDKFSCGVYVAAALVLTVFMLTPIILYFSCNIDSECMPFAWKATDLLQYIGTATGAIGTVILGCCTIYISRREHKINQKIMQITDRATLREAREQMPLIDIAKLKISNENIKIRIIYDQTCEMYRVTVWVKHSFSYAIKYVRVKNASLGLVDTSFKNKIIEVDKNKRLTYSPNSSYVKKKALLPNQETVFSMYFSDNNDIDELKQEKKLLFYLLLEFENENNNGEKLEEIIKLSFRGKMGLDEEDFLLYSEEVTYEWIND